jgi:hypothetical protein
MLSIPSSYFVLGMSLFIKISDRDIGDQEYNFYNQFPQLDFPVKKLPNDFDPRRIKGLVADLITVTNPEYIAAIETHAAGKLYNLVVDSQD